MSEGGILTTISQEVGKFKDIISSVYGETSPLNFKYFNDSKNPMDFTMVTFRFYYLFTIQRYYTYSTEKLIGQDLNYIFSIGILDLIEYLKSHINDEISDSFPTNPYFDATFVLQENLSISSNALLDYDKFDKCLMWSPTLAEQSKVAIAYCDNLPKLDSLPYEVQVQVLYEFMIQAMIEPLQRIYDKLCI